MAAQSLYTGCLGRFDAKDYASARRLAETLLANSRFADNRLLPDLLCIAAESHLAAGGDAAKAERYYRRVAERFPKTNYSAEGGYKLGEMAARHKKYDEAVTRYKQCLTEARGQFRRAGQVWAGRR